MHATSKLDCTVTRPIARAESNRLNFVLGLWTQLRKLTSQQNANVSRFFGPLWCYTPSLKAPFHSPNRSQLVIMDSELFWYSHPLSTLVSPPVQTWIWYNPSCGHQSSSHHCSISSIDQWGRHNWHWYHWINQSAPWNPSTGGSPSSLGQQPFKEVSSTYHCRTSTISGKRLVL